LALEAGFASPIPVESNVNNDSTTMTPCARNEQSIGSPSWVKRLSGIWSTENIKIARRVIVSVVGATVLLIGVALLVLPGPAFIVIPIGLAILATEYAWARRWLKKVRRMASNVVSSRSRTTREDSGV
jgi:tellurite resistance protein TerC